MTSTCLPRPGPDLGPRADARRSARVVGRVPLDRAGHAAHHGPVDDTWEVAARTALEERIPLVAVISSSGADIHEGVDALARLGTRGGRAHQVLGRRSHVRDRRRPGGVGSGAAARADGLRRHDQQRLRLRERPGHGAPVHRHRRHQGGARQRRPTSNATPASWSPSCPTARRARHVVEELLGLPARPRRRTAAALAADRPGRPAVPRGRRADPRVVDRQLRRAQGDRGDRRRRRAARGARRAGRPTSSPPSPPSAGARSASSPTSR